LIGFSWRNPALNLITLGRNTLDHHHVTNTFDHPLYVIKV